MGSRRIAAGEDVGDLEDIEGVVAYRIDVDDGVLVEHLAVVPVAGLELVVAGADEVGAAVFLDGVGDTSEKRIAMRESRPETSWSDW